MQAQARRTAGWPATTTWCSLASLSHALTAVTFVVVIKTPTPHTPHHSSTMVAVAAAGALSRGVGLVGGIGGSLVGAPVPGCCNQGHLLHLALGVFSFRATPFVWRSV